MSLDADLGIFVDDHRPHGSMTTDATTPAWNGYLLTKRSAVLAVSSGDLPDSPQPTQLHQIVIDSPPVGFRFPMQWCLSAPSSFCRSTLAGRLQLLSRLIVALALIISLATPTALMAEDAKEAWEALAKGGHVALIRHGNAPPGFGGDPPGFRLDDCATQRNLDDKGRAQGRALGDAFRNRGVRVDRIVSSPVCRCIDTANLMAVGQVDSSLALLPDRDAARPRLRELKEIVSGWRGPGTLVLVTHGFTIEALLGFIPEQAETIVLRPTPGVEDGAHVVRRIAPPR